MLNIQKKSFSILDFEFENKRKIPITLGYETYGNLNESKDNVVLVPHYFSASSHAAGKYNESDLTPGYWDALIGPSKAIDTNKYFVISIDNLANVQVNNPNVITTGPRSINPKTNKIYGLTFPVFTFKDIAKIQHEFLFNQLGIKQIHTVIGASAGGFIGLEWITTFADKVKNFIGVITNPKNPVITSFNVIEHAMRAIELDPNWSNGSYNNNQPVEGLKLAIQMMNVGAFTSEFFEHTYKRDDLDIDAYKDIKSKLSFEIKLQDAINASSKLIDASHWYYTCKATMLHNIFFGSSSTDDVYKKIKANVLMISCENDLLQPTIFNKIMVEHLKSLGKQAELFTFTSSKGHMAGILDTCLFEHKIKEMLG